MVEVRELKLKRFLESNTTMTINEIENLFEFKESESDTILNKISEKTTLIALDSMSLGASLDDDKNQIGKKRKAGDLQLLSYVPEESMSRSRDTDSDNYHFRSKRRYEHSPSFSSYKSVTNTMRHNF